MDRGYALVCARGPLAERLIASLPIPGTRVDPEALLQALSKRRPSIVFVELDLLPRLDRGVFTLPVVALVDGTLPTAIDALARYPFLSHLVAEPLLAMPHAAAHLAQLLARMAHGPEHVMVADDAVGRTALLASSQRREARFERMREFFAQSGVSSRAIGVATDTAEELVTNALYDAPVEARYFAQAIPRTEPVELPPEHACEISYGLDGGHAFVRVRDPFGALSRERLLGVLQRCRAGNVSVDESRGGAGLGLWRVFSLASTIAITVISGRLTDVLARIDTSKHRGGARPTLAVHLFFPPRPNLDGIQGRFAADHDYDLLDESFTSMHPT